MEAVKLSIEARLVKWATFFVDWFMDFFAEPEYYWAAETYPSDAVVATAGRALNVKVKMVPRFSFRAKERLKNPVFMAQINWKEIISHFHEAWAARYFNLFSPGLIPNCKVAGPIMV